MCLSLTGHRAASLFRGRIPVATASLAPFCLLVSLVPGFVSYISRFALSFISKDRNVLLCGPSNRLHETGRFKLILPSNP